MVLNARGGAGGSSFHTQPPKLLAFSPIAKGRGWRRSVAAAATVPATVGVSRRGLAVLGPPAEDLVRAVVAAAAGHARRSLVDFEPKGARRERESERERGLPALTTTPHDSHKASWLRRYTHCKASLKNWYAPWLCLKTVSITFFICVLDGKKHEKKTNVQLKRLTAQRCLTHTFSLQLPCGGFLVNK